MRRRATLGLLAAWTAWSAAPARLRAATDAAALAPVLPLNTDDLAVDGAWDLRRRPLLALPPGFRCWAVSCTGQRMSDGTRVPGDHDGMAAFPGRDGGVVLVRNHELGNGERKFGDAAGVALPPQLKYDPFANGGTTTLVLDRQGRLVRDFASLGGTDNNCAGGATPWGSWLSCEETVALPDTAGLRHRRAHGYVFEVPAAADAPVPAEPVVAMGRFVHEAAAVDPATGIVYLTEDAGDGLLYRFVPSRRPRAPGDLRRHGGRLQALRLSDAGESVDTGRAWPAPAGRPLAVQWVDVDEPDPRDNAPERSTRAQGRSRGAARFTRGEGAWFADGHVFFTATSGGAARAGQVWALDAAKQTLALLHESTDRDRLDMPDNLCVGPDGRLYLFEDGDGGNGIVVLDRDGRVGPFARNVANDSELAGGCFSPDGRRLFVNIQRPGLTLVIEGPFGA